MGRVLFHQICLISPKKIGARGTCPSCTPLVAPLRTAGAGAVEVVEVKREAPSYLSYLIRLMVMAALLLFHGRNGMEE